MRPQPIFNLLDKSLLRGPHLQELIFCGRRLNQLAEAGSNFKIETESNPILALKILINEAARFSEGTMKTFTSWFGLS
jgi:hypothetical protein